MTNTTSELRQKVDAEFAKLYNCGITDLERDEHNGQFDYVVYLESAKQLTVALLAAEKQRWEAKIRIDELTRVYQSYGLNNTGHKYYNDRLAALDGVIGGQK